MRPNNDKPPVAKPLNDASQQGGPIRLSSIKPEYRYDHELPAPKPQVLLEDDHKPDLMLEDETKPPKKKKSLAKKILVVVIALLLSAVAAVIGAYVWYVQQLEPVAPDKSDYIKIRIESGSSPSMIAEQLKSADLIKSKLAFSIYTKLSNTENTLKAGVFRLQMSMTTQEIVNHIVAGKQDTFKITFLPGDTLANNRKKLIGAGFSEADVDAALNKTYNRTLFADKPATADLEGYIFGDTYTFDASSTPETILNQTFDEFEVAIEQNNIVALLKKQNLSLYQGITLASIVQREVTNQRPNIPNDDQKQVARVFMNRMAKGMNLGSDVTYQYAARKMGVSPTPTLDSPYNTRIYTGLPPGPIATPGIGALVAVAEPATNDYLFFLSGDDDVTYFGRTEAEHQRNIDQHCAKKCLIL